MTQVLAVFAHPDDECFAGGGLLSELAARGCVVTCVIATGGEAAERAADSVEEARGMRIAKYEASLSVLGISAWSWLSAPGRWVDHHAGPRVAIEDPDVLASAVRDKLEGVSPDLIVTFGEHGLAGHPDHIAIAGAVHRATLLDGIPRGGILGADVPQSRVAATMNRLRALHPKRALGSGMLLGSPAQLVAVDVSAAARRRQRALDVYQPGLGTDALANLAGSSDRLGDSFVLRAFFEDSGWQTETFQWCT